MSDIKHFIQYVSGMAAAALSIVCAAGLTGYFSRFYAEHGFSLPSWIYAAVCIAAMILGTAAILGSEVERDRVYFGIAMTAVSVISMIGLGAPVVSNKLYAVISVCAIISAALTVVKQDAEWLLFVGGAFMAVLSVAGAIGAVRFFGSDRDKAYYYIGLVIAAIAAAVLLLKSHVLVLLSSMLSLAAVAFTVWGFADKTRTAEKHILISIGLSLASLILSAVLQKANSRYSDVDWKALDVSGCVSGVQKIIFIVLLLLLLGTYLFGDRVYFDSLKHSIQNIGLFKHSD